MSILRDIRIGKGITREQLAELVGVTPTTIYRKECGLRKITTKDLDKFAIALGCDASDFLGKAPENKDTTTVHITMRFAAEWAMEYVETLPASARKNLTARKFAEFFLLLHEVLNEQAAEQVGNPTRPSPLVMDAILSKASQTLRK